MTRLLIKNAATVTMDDALGDFEKADILIEDGAIKEIRPDMDADASIDAEVIDAEGMIAIPGLWDAHRHTWQTGLRGILADGRIPDYLRGFRLQMATLYRPEDMYAANYAGGLDCLENGVTGLVDYCHNIIDEAYARASVEGLMASGVRGLYGHGMVPVTENTFADGKGLAEGNELSDLSHNWRYVLARKIRSEYFSDDSLLRFGIAPQELAIAPAAEVAQEFELARELNARITFHSNQVAVPNGGMCDMHTLSEHGLLGPDVNLVHMTFTNPDEWDIVEGSGASITLCAETEMQMGMGFPVAIEATRYTEAGPSLGMDCTSSTSGDMLAHARLVLQCTRWLGDAPHYENFSHPKKIHWTTRDALAWVTINGARAAGVDDITGSLTPGKRADIVLLDMRGIAFAGWNRKDPCSMVVSQANSRNVHTVMVDGKIVKQGGPLLHVDPKAAVATLESSHDFLNEIMAEKGGFIPQPPVPLPLYEA
ncbi:amidohydrolase family protein [Tropicimonas sp. IMCC34043]|uniref:amidohydrolase family protein n=1 Tax=Tropicimonas sp. IMCC34043 TaxID=2248760 RepID=UPI000E229C51|nr:amidohydrolase family protein [Tropicimonas sp. IMCC34043]